MGKTWYQNLGEFVTGRDSNADYVGENPDAVAGVVNQLNTIATGSDGAVEQGRQKVIKAIDALNSTKGMEYITEIPTADFTTMFDQIGESINSIASNLSSVASDLEEYSNSALYEKLGSSFAMAGAKFGEGVLSIGENVGDAFLSVGGFVGSLAGADTTGVENLIKKNWSHDAFNFYYKSDLAKKSAFTEDSGAAGACKIVGQTVGYMAGTGFLAGTTGLSTIGAGSKGLGIISGASGATRASAIFAGVTGLGQGTETGLQEGQSMKQAFGTGVKQGVSQAAVAFTAGRITDQVKLNKNTNTQDALKQYKEDKEAYKELVKEAKKDGTYSSSKADLNDLKEGAVDQFKNVAKTENIQSIDNSIYNKHVTRGEKVNTAIKEAIEGKSRIAKTVTGVKTFAGETFNQSVKQPLSNIKVNGLGSTLKDEIKSMPSGLKEGANTGVFLNALGNNISESNGNAAAQFRNLTKNSGGSIRNIKVSDPDIKEFPSSQISDSDPGVNIAGGSNGDGSRNTKSNGNGFNSDGSKGGGSNGGGSSYGDGSTSKQQFRKSDDDSQTADKSKKSTTNDTTKTSDKKTTPDATKTSDTKTTSDTTKTSDKKTTPDATKTSDTTPKSNNTAAVNIPQDKTTVHTGGGYSASNGYTGTGDYTGANTGTGDYTGANSETGVTDDISGITSVLDDGTTSIEDVIKGSKYTKIPTSSKPIMTTSSSGSSAVIPIAAGLSAAAAAGIGAKAYMDRKKNNDNGEDDEEFDTDEWTGDDAVDIQYDDSSDTNAGENVLDADDDYSYQPAEETEKYDARSSDELADLQ